MEDARRKIEVLFRQEYGRILASLIRFSRDFELAEEALQDALTIACERWPSGGAPGRPAAWIATTARNRLLDRLRRRQVAQGKLAEVALARGEANQEEDMVAPAHDFPHGDDRLRLIFTCCHPAIGHEAQVALTLNTLCGLTVPEIARAFLVKDRAMAQRLVRAKRKIRTAGIPYAVPSPSLLVERLPAVLAVVYLVFNEGYSASGGDALVRRDLTREALRLGRLLAELLPGEPEVGGLLALMLLQGSRGEARQTAEGDLVLLEDQDRSRWDADAIEEGQRVLEAALARGRPGPFQLQAAIAAVHSEAGCPEQTDWPEIVGLYDALLVCTPSPVIALNRAVAVALAEGPEQGLEAVDALVATGNLEDYVYLHATRADFLRRLGRRVQARAAYERALALVGNGKERAFLLRRLTELDV